jgi:hypothetical protein
VVALVFHVNSQDLQVAAAEGEAHLPVKLSETVF